jgi:acyl transferase domain-containing protein
VIKMVMAMHHGVLPRTLHVDRPSSEVDWSAGAVSLLTEAKPWPQGEQPRRAAVSSFGISGTNAHLILEQAPQESIPSAGQAHAHGGEDIGVSRDSDDAVTVVPSMAGILPWVICGQGEDALRAQARQLLDYVRSSEELGANDVGYSLARRTMLQRRAVLLGRGRDDLLEALRALARGETAPNLVCGADREGGVGAAGTVAFMFTGQGAQRVGMGRELYREFELYRRTFDEISAHLNEHLTSPVQEVVFGADSGKVDAPENGGRASRSALLDQTAFAQAGLFALEVALFRLVESWGVRPDFLIGHSIGELAAAHLSGVFSLEDACRLVAARGRLMGELPQGGAMVAVQASEEEGLASLAGFEDRVALAAVNGPASIVLSGEQEAVLQLTRLWEDRSRKTKHLRVSHAFHSPRMDDMLERFGEVAAGMSFSPPQIPIVSNLTGEPVSAEEICSTEYWVRHVRETVRFGAGIAWLGRRGVRCFLELGPDGVLSASTQETLGGDGTMETERIAAAALLRRERSEVETLEAALAEVFVRGVDVNWASMFADSGAKRVKLPTYAFQRQRYWLAPQSVSGGMAAVGQSATDHPLLGGAIELAGDRGGVFTGLLSLQTHPWLSDHTAMGAVLLPGTAYVDLALHVGGELGVELLSELTLEAPLLMDEHSAVLLQVSVGDADESGRRALDIYSRPAAASGAALIDGAWTRHATGLLAPALPGWELADPRIEALRERWPPRGAEPLELADLYERLADHGLDYGPAFQGLRAAWRRGEELFAEVSLAEDQHAQESAFAIHPALLDAAFHALIDDGAGGADMPAPLRLPFSFSGVGLGLRGARSLRVRLGVEATDTASLVAVDETGAAVISIDSLVAREVSEEQLSAGRSNHYDSLLRTSWVTVPVDSDASEATGKWTLLGRHATATGEALQAAGIACEIHPNVESIGGALERAQALPETVLLDCASYSSDDSLPASMHTAVNRVLEELKQWLADERLSVCRLVLLTRGTLAARPGDEVPGLAEAAVWGLVRSAQAENPERFVLVDHDGVQDSWKALAGALACGESQLALRAGNVLVPRLEYVVRGEKAGAGPKTKGNSVVGAAGVFDPQKTVLVTGGIGGLGALVARHLVSNHGVRHLLLASRKGPEAPAAAELEAELTGLGAEVTIAACDVSVREQLERLLDSVDERHPLGAVVHMAAATDNGLVDSLTPERIDTALAPKADGAWNLHELTGHLELSAFVLFSSIAGLFGGCGQGNYAAANLFLDRLAEYRRAHGLVATSVVWGLWGEAGAGAEMGATAVRRVVGSSSMGPLSSEDGLELLDLALGVEDATVLAARLDMSVLRAEARAGVLKPLLRGLVQVPLRRASGDDGGALARRLGAMSQEERADALLELVRAEAAVVLGLSSAKAIEPGRAFKEIGFDSLAGVELRNRLGTAIQMRLPATLSFDHPNARELALYLLGELEQRVDLPGESMDDALEALERMAIASQGPERRRVAARLRACLSMLDGAGTEDDLASATDEEMFEILDTELGAL